MPIEFEYINDEGNDNNVETEEDSDEDEEEIVEEDETEDIENEVDVIETIVDDEEIDEMIKILNELKETKESAVFEIDDETQIVFHHEESLEEEDENAKTDNF